MGGEHAPETVWRAQELYCVDRLSFDAVAKSLGVADSTVRRWADKFGWRKERDEIAKAESEIRANMVKSRARVLEKLLTAGDGKEASMLAFATNSLERLADAREAAKRKEALKTGAAADAHLVRQNEKSAPEEAPLATLPDGLGDDERLALMETAINKQLAFVLTSPVPDISRRIKEIKAAMDILAKARGVDADAGKVIFSFEGDEGE